MTLSELLSNPAVPRSLVVGTFGAAGLVLTVIYSRRGPRIFPVYSALLVALALVVARYPALPYPARFGAVLAGFVVATAPLYVAAGVLAARDRRRLRAEGRIPADARGVSLFGHAWRVAGVLAIGSGVSAGVAFVAA